MMGTLSYSALVKGLERMDLGSFYFFKKFLSKIYIFLSEM